MSFPVPKILLLAVILYSCGKNPEPRRLQDLSHEKWEFRQAGDSIWREATVPGLIHTDLLKHKLIPHPWKGLNEEKVQWIEEQDWEYRCSFDIEKK